MLFQCLFCVLIEKGHGVESPLYRVAYKEAQIRVFFPEILHGDVLYNHPDGADIELRVHAV